MMEPVAVDTQPRRVLLSLIEVPIALGVAFATFVGFSMAGCAWARCVDVSGLPWYLGGALLGIAVAIIYWGQMMRLRDRFRSRLIVDAIAIAVGVAGVVLPQLGGWRAEREAKHAPPRVVPRAGDVAPLPSPTAPQPKIAR
jgi:hypothetical protein